MFLSLVLLICHHVHLLLVDVVAALFHAAPVSAAALVDCTTKVDIWKGSAASLIGAVVLREYLDPQRESLPAIHRAG